MMGEAIRKARVEAGLSQQELGERLHVVRQTVSKWEKGASVPDAELLVALAEALGVEVTALLGQDDGLARNLDELALRSALLNEQLAVQGTRLGRLVRLGRRAAAALAAVAVALVAWGGFRFVADYLVPQDQHAIYLDYEIDGREGRAQIWLDSHDQSVARGYALDEGELADVILAGTGESTLAGFLGKPSSALMLMSALQVTIESQGGTVTGISAYDYEY